MLEISMALLILFVFVYAFVSSIFLNKKIDALKGDIHDTEFKNKHDTQLHLELIRQEFINAYLSDTLPIVPKIIIEAKERGFLNKDDEMLIKGVVYKFVKVVEVSSNEIKILAEGRFEPIGLMYNTTHRVLTIYKDGLWAEIEKPKKNGKHDTLRDINSKK